MKLKLTEIAIARMTLLLKPGRQELAGGSCRPYHRLSPLLPHAFYYKIVPHALLY
jgi:hypothetical protein